MKAGVTPVVSSAWWKSNKAMTVKAAPLEGALKDYEVARMEFAKQASANTAAAIEKFMAAKTALSVGVTKAVDTTIASCNKLIHKDDIAGLEKYKSVAIPKEKGELDKLYSQFEARYQKLVDDMRGEMEEHVAALDEVGNLSASTVLQCEQIEAEADKALAEATQAKGAADAAAADAAMQKAVKAGAQAAKLEAALKDAVKKAPPKKLYPLNTLTKEDRAALSKLGDKKKTVEDKIDNNSAKVEKICAGVRATMAQARQVAAGSVKAEDALVAAMDRLVNRAFALAQLGDQPTREMKAAISNLEGDVMEFDKANGETDKSLHAKRAVENMRMAKIHAGAVRVHLDKADQEVNGLLKSMPAAIVNRSNATFTKLFAELDKATKAFTADEATLAKETQKLKALESQVARMT